MAKLIQRLKVLEAEKIPRYVMPIIMLIGDDGETDSQLLEIDEAQKCGRNVVRIVREIPPHG